MDKTHLKIEGMTCQHCVSHVTEALEGVAGVASAKVNLKKGEAVGFKKGATQEKREIAKNLKALNLTKEQIAEATGLSAAEIEKL